MSVQQPIITDVGKAALINVNNNGFELELTHIGFGTSNFVPDGTETTATDEIKRVGISGSVDISPTSFQILANVLADEGAAAWISSLYFYAGDVLFAVFSTETGNIFHLSERHTSTVNYVLDVSSLPEGSVSIMIDAEAAASLKLIGEQSQVILNELKLYVRELSEGNNLDGPYLVTPPVIAVNGNAVAGRTIDVSVSGGRSAFKSDTEVETVIDHYEVIFPNEDPVNGSSHQWLVPADKNEGDIIEIEAVAVDNSVYANKSRAARIQLTVVGNESPLLGSMVHTFPSSASSGDVIQFAISGATDPDGATVTYNLLNATTGLSFDVETGISDNQVITATISESFTDGAGFSFDIQAEDGDGFKSGLSHVVSVISNNATPTTDGLVVNFPETIHAGDTVVLTISGGSDADNDTLSYRINNPVGLSFPILSGIQPNSEQSVVVLASLGHGDTVSFDVVIDDGQAQSTPVTVTRTITAVKPDISAMTNTFPTDLNVCAEGTFKIENISDGNNLPVLLAVSVEGIEFTPSQNIAVGDDIAYKVSCTATTGTKNIAVVASNQYVSDSTLIETTISAPTGTVNPNDGDTVTIGPGVSSLQLIGNGGAGMVGTDGQYQAKYLSIIPDTSYINSVGSLAKPGDYFPEIVSAPDLNLLTPDVIPFYFPSDKGAVSSVVSGSSFGLLEVRKYTQTVYAGGWTTLVVYVGDFTDLSAEIAASDGISSGITGDLTATFAGAAESITDTPPESTETLVLDPSQIYTITVSKPVGTSLRLEY